MLVRIKLENSSYQKCMGSNLILKSLKWLIEIRHENNINKKTN